MKISTMKIFTTKISRCLNTVALLVLAGGVCAQIARAADDNAPVLTKPPIALSDWGTSRAPNAKAVRAAIDLGAAYLVGASQDSGQWIYLAYLDPAVKVKPDYNEVRHAGAIYALAAYFQAAQRAGAPDAKLQEQVKTVTARAAKYFVARYVAPLDAKAAQPNGVLGVWSRPDDQGMKDGGAAGASEAKLGGGGLGLAGLVGAESLAPGTTDLETLRGLARGILALQNPDGSFASKYSQSAAPINQGSLYFPGEAILGLTMLSEFEKDAAQKTVWLDAAIKGLGFLARSRRGKTSVPADHWALIATGKLWPYLSDETDKRTGVSRAEILAHAIQICKTMMRDPALHDTRTTPVATRLEGLLAVYPILSDDQGTLKNQIKRAAGREVSRFIAAQTKTGKMIGAIARDFDPTAAPGDWVDADETAPQPDATLAAPEAALPTDPHAGEVRIDYVQHAISALMSYDALFDAPTANGKNP